MTQIIICDIADKCKAATQRKTQLSTQLSAAPQDGYDRFLEYFNQKVEHTPIKSIRTLSDARKKALRSIFKEFGGKEVVEEALDKIVRSQWCCGENDKGWVASFDWIFKKSNFIKILEGNYDNRTRPITATDSATTRAQSRDRLRALATGVISQSADKLLSLYNDKGKDPHHS